MLIIIRNLKKNVCNVVRLYMYLGHFLRGGKGSSASSTNWIRKKFVVQK